MHFYFIFVKTDFVMKRFFKLFAAAAIVATAAGCTPHHGRARHRQDNRRALHPVEPPDPGRPEDAQRRNMQLFHLPRGTQRQGGRPHARKPAERSQGHPKYRSKIVFC